MTLRFDQPEWLWLLLPVVALASAAIFRLRGEETVRLGTIIAFRVLVMGALVVALARPAVIRRHDDLAVVALVDVSESVRRFGSAAALEETRRPVLASIRDWIRSAAEDRRPDDRIGLVVFDGRPTVVAVPRRVRDPVDEIDVTGAEGTDIAAALRLGSALFPADANRRLLLVTDGNDTVGGVLEAARAAATTRGGTVPIDVLPVTYSIGPDVQIVRIEAPPTGRPGQSVALRVVMESSAAISGSLSLLREGRIVDVDLQSDAFSRRVDVPRGESVQVLVTTLDDAPLSRFEVVFEPDDPARDALDENNRGEAVVTNPGTGAVLVLRGSDERTNGSTGDSPFEELVRSLRRPVVAGPPGILPQDLLGLQAFDLVVLDDVAASQIDPADQARLVEYVERLGGGLLMSGGPHSFGAGGWKGTPIEPLLPVSLELPRRLRQPRAALILVLDKSGSMAQPVAGARASQQEIANEAAAIAIESLAARSYIGVIAFDAFAETVVDLTVNDDPKQIADAVRRIDPNGGTNIAAGLLAAQKMMRRAEGVEERRIVFLTDGRSQTQPIEDVLHELVDEGVTITTIAIGDDTDEATLAHMAAVGGGEFHAVRNPRLLPRILVDSVQVLNQPLIREEPFQALPLATGGRLAQDALGAPDLLGLVITSPREDATAIVELVAAPDEPLLAHWPAGVGYVAAFTSSIEGAWAQQWLTWPGWSRLWSDVIRQASRPGAGGGMALDVTVDGDRLVIVLAVDEASPLDPGALAADALVYDPEGRPTELVLRQVSARRFEAEHTLLESGTYVVAAMPREGGRPLAPLVTGATRPPGAEFRRTRSNLALLREIVELSGGRVLDPEAPSAAELFDRSGMVPVEAARSIWTVLLIAALPLLLLDAATRRIAWSPHRIAEAVRTSVARRRLARSSRATLDRLRTVGGVRVEVDEAARAAAITSTQAQAELAKARRRVERASPQAILRPDPPPDPRTDPRTDVPSSPRAASVTSTPRSADASSTPESPPVPSTSPDPSASPEQTTTESLLEAKRRARDRLG